MSEEIITTKRGVYGRVNITLPLAAKIAMLALQKKSGMKKAEFLRMALTTGLVELSKSILVASWTAEVGGAQGRPPVSVSADGRPAPLPGGGHE